MTMARTLELYWDFSSPFAYLGSTQAEALAARTGATLVWRPMLLGAVFKAIGAPDAPILTWSDAKRAYFFKDLMRWAEHWGVPFNFPARFPMVTVKPLRVWLALPEERRGAFRDAAFRAYWAEGADISDDATLRALVGDGADEVLARCGTKEVKDALFASTQRAIDAGVFGAPTWVVDGRDLFWGQDRIVLVERALRAPPPAA
jgi:2-hydroxychromene-2-carboxylate isomerase